MISPSEKTDGKSTEDPVLLPKEGEYERTKNVTKSNTEYSAIEKDNEKIGYDTISQLDSKDYETV